MFERSFDPVAPPSLPSISFTPPSADPQIPATEARNRTVNAYELSSKIPKRCSFSCHSYITSDGEPKVIVFGGACIDEGAWKHYNDVHLLDGTTMEWEEVTTRGTGPSPRRCASSWMVGDSLYVWGGRYEDERTDAVDYNDMWRFDVGAKEWTVIEQVQEPVQRRSATCWTCETKDGTWLFMIGGEIRLLGRNDLRELVAIHGCKISQEQRTASWESGSIVMCHSFSKAHGLQHSNLYVVRMYTGDRPTQATDRNTHTHTHTHTHFRANSSPSPLSALSNVLVVFAVPFGQRISEALHVWRCSI